MSEKIEPWLSHNIESLLACFEKPMDLVNMRALFLYLIRAHFADAENFGEYKTALECMTYKGPDSDGLVIALSHTLGPETERTLPSIFISIGGVIHSKLSIADHAGNLTFETEDSEGYEHIRTSEYIVRVHCNADSMDMSATMALSVLDFLEAMSQESAKNIGLKDMDVLGMNLTEPNKRHPEPRAEFTHTVSTKVLVNYALSVRERSHKLKRWIANINLIPT